MDYKPGDPMIIVHTTTKWTEIWAVDDYNYLVAVWRKARQADETMEIERYRAGKIEKIEIEARQVKLIEPMDP